MSSILNKESVQKINKLSFFEKIKLFDSIDRFYYLGGILFLFILLVKFSHITKYIFEILIIIIIVVFIVSNIDFNNRNLVIENINNKYEKFKDKYNYLWLDANIILFLDSILYIRNYTETNYDDLVKNIDKFFRIQYEWEFNKKPQNSVDIKLYCKLYNDILNTYQSFYVSCPSKEKYNLQNKQTDLLNILNENVKENIEPYSEGWFILNMPNYYDNKKNSFDLF
jgi:hypothetical protein